MASKDIQPATKKDIQVLEKDLRRDMATKQGLQKLEKDLRKDMATKKDLQKLEKDLRKDMATKKDLQETESRTVRRMEELFVQYKSEFFQMIDPILKEVVASREERSVTAHQLQRHSDRLDKVEKKLHNLQA